jgi:very-short-patch-repair endonuclease
MMWAKCRTSKMGKICFGDIITNILNVDYTDDHKLMIDKSDIYLISKNIYVSEHVAIKFILLFDGPEVILFCKNMLKNDDLVQRLGFFVLTEKYIVVGDCNILYYLINGDTYYKAIDVCAMLNYKRSRNAVSLHVDSTNKIDFIGLVKKSFDCNILLKYTKIDQRTIFVNNLGITELILKSEKTGAIKYAKYFGIDVKQKFVRKEIEIVHELEKFCISAKLNFKPQHYLKVDDKIYRIDFYLPDHKIVIEIDEFDHVHRNRKYETTRQSNIEKYLGCTFIRCNPDDANFNISSLLGNVYNVIMNMLSGSQK